MPHDLTLPSLTGQIPYDVEEAINRLRAYGLELAGVQDQLDGRLVALGDVVAAAASGGGEEAAQLIATIETLDLTAETITVTDLIIIGPLPPASAGAIRDAGYWSPLILSNNPGDSELVLVDDAPVMIWIPTP